VIVANKQAAQKYLRASQRRRMRNKPVRTRARTAVRDAMLDGNPVAEGEYMGLLNDKFVEGGETPHPVIMQMLERVADDEPEALTIYVGQATPAAQAGELASEISDRYPDMDVQTVAGGQDHYDYIIAVE